MRETAKLERDAKKLQAKQKKEEMLAKKSVDAIENKAKRVLEMQDRILSRKKIKYKDKEEEKLGKLAEDLAQTVRSAKEKLEKLEKEDASLKKKVRCQLCVVVQLLLELTVSIADLGGSSEQETKRSGGHSYY